MRNRKAFSGEDREPIYDDCMIEQIGHYETVELIEALVQYCKTLESQVVQLRCRVNMLTPAGEHEPFPDPEGDLYEVFYHYAAYPKFKEVLKPLE